MSFTRQHHGDVMLIGGVYRFLVAYRATGLDDSVDAQLGSVLDDVPDRTITLQNVGRRVRRVRLLGVGTRLKWRVSGDDLVITLRAPLLAGPHAFALDGLVAGQPAGS